MGNNKVSNNDVAQNVTSALVAGASGGITYNLSKKVLRLIVKPKIDTLRSNILNMNSIFNEPALKALANEGIAYTNVTNTYDYLKDDNVNVLLSDYMKTTKNSYPKNKKIITNLNKCAEGKTAFHYKDKVFLNFDAISGISFHEMGHAKNYKEPIGRVLKFFRCTGVTKFLLGCAILGALLPKYKEKNTEVDNDVSVVNKGKNFLKNNCTEIAALSTIPILVEKGLATIRGNKIAKTVLSKELLKVVKNYYKKGWLTYLASAALKIVSVFMIDKVRNCFST